MLIDSVGVGGAFVASTTNLVPPTLPLVPANTNVAYLIPVSPMNSFAFTTELMATSYANYKLDKLRVELTGCNTSTAQGFMFCGMMQTS